MTSPTSTPATAPGDLPSTPAGRTGTPRSWQRVGLGCLAVALVGLGWGAHALVQRQAPRLAPTAHVPIADHAAHAVHPPAPAVVLAPPAPGPRVPIDRVSVENIGQLERDTAAVLAAGGTGDVAVLRTDFNRVFQQCTTTGADHEALHGFLAPVADGLARVEAASGPARREAVRALLHQLGQFDAGFAPAP